MGHEILTVKLCELDARFARLHRRIRQSETAGHPQLQQAMRVLRQEHDKTALALQNRLRHSRTGMAAILADCYGEIAQSVQTATDALRQQALDSGDPEAAAEEKIFLAEYALDFVLQGADRALLLAMEAIDAQYAGQEGDSKSL